MRVKLVEATNVSGGGINWGKFMLQQLTEELLVRSEIDQRPLVTSRGWDPARHLMVFDLQTGEGALFNVVPNGCAKHDLNKRKIWVCPLFEPFLAWLLPAAGPVRGSPSWCTSPTRRADLLGYRREGKG